MESPLHEITPQGLEVIETLGYTPQNGFARLELHLDRCTKTCARLQFPFDRADALQRLNAASGTSAARLRMTVNKAGDITVTTGALLPNQQPWQVQLSDQIVHSDDPWRGIKTTMRETYDTARRHMPAGIDEMIFLNQRGEICEGTITNIFVKQNNNYLTPPLTSGALAGVLRQEMLNNGQAREAVLHPADLAQGFYIGNSLRGLIKARL